MRFLLASVFVIAMATAQTDPPPDCPFGPGSCPVTLDNVVNVFFHDIADDISCQLECQTINDCNYFTMFGVTDDPVDHKKCFLFKECDTLEECIECTTGPAYPPIDECEPSPNYSCNTDLDNIVDVFYFDAEDDFSCHNQCVLLNDCNFWTSYIYEEETGPKQKCFLFKTCNIHEPCNTCIGGPKGASLL